MTVISYLDMLAALTSLGACLILALRGWHIFTSAERWIVFSVGALTVALNGSNFWVWRGQLVGADLAENWADYLQILQPVLWGMFFYIVVQVAQRKALERSRQQMRDLVEHMPVILHAYDEQGRILAWNSHAEEVTGFSKAEVIGCDLALQKIFPDIDYREQLLMECRNHGASYQHRLRPMRCKQRFERQVAWFNISQECPIEGWANWGIGLDMTEQVNAQKSLEHMATHDELTGLANRALLRDRLAHALTSSRREQVIGALILMDLDHFKMINDSHGHPVGDQLLCEVAERLRGCLKSTDTLARMGGDEFVILLEKVGRPEEVSLIAERLLAAISQLPFYLYGSEIRIRCSMGITLFPSDDVRIDELIKNVDLALYAAKEAGRNNYHFYSRSLHNKLRWQHRVSEKLREAIDIGSFSLHYQPQIALQDHQVIGLEALLRWDAYDEVPLSPAAFVPIAESTGLMPSLGRWVVEAACKQAALWQSQGLIIPIAINLSSVQFYQPNLAEALARVVEDHHLDPTKIEFELTESTVMRNMDNAIATMRQLTQRGFSISLDDFGSGHSSLGYLKRFPVAKIKIDQSFVRGIETDRVDASIVRSVIDLGHSLDMKVLAEGVETVGQIERLGNEGCDYIQGFYFSKPLPERAVEPFMQACAPH